jgi:uncharacterized membrane protein YtjA (UPF0391 family)
MDPAMFRYAIVFLVLSLIAGGFGLTNFSALFKRISLIFFVLFFWAFSRCSALPICWARRSTPAHAPS